MSLYFVRHGQTDANLKLQHGEAAGGDDNSSLNQTGIDQLENTANDLKDLKIDVILSSPLKRASQSAEIINKHHGLPIIIEDDLRERDGCNTDGKTWIDSFDIDRNLRLPKGENTVEFFDRIYGVIKKLEEEHGDKNIVVVAHSGVHYGFYAYFNNLPWTGNMRTERIENGEFRKYEFK